MPIYEYKCRDKGHLFEVIQKMSDPVVEICEKCGGAVDRLVSRTSFQLKGTGWYTTDYKQSASTSTSADATKSESKDSGQTEKKV